MDNSVEAFNIEVDVQRDVDIDLVKKNLKLDSISLLFDPDEYKDKKDELTIERQSLSIEELQEFAMLSTRLRAQFISQAK